MSRSVRARILLVATSVACLLVLGGCGSAASTSRAEATFVAAAEGRFLKEWGRAEGVEMRRCPQMDARRREGCIERIAEPGNLRAMRRFKADLERILEGGLGPECRVAVEEDIASMASVPPFAGQAAAACRSESK